jgi:hypothetical protein
LVDTTASHHTVTVSLNVTGTVEAWEDMGPQVAVPFAIACGVHSDDITVTFQAGSVIINIEIRVPDAAGVTKVENALAAPMTDATAATAFLGSGILGYSGRVQEVVHMTTAAAETGLSTGVLIAIIAGGVVGVILLVAIIVYMTRKPASSSSGGGKNAAHV